MGEYVCPSLTWKLTELILNEDLCTITELFTKSHFILVSLKDVFKSSYFYIKKAIKNVIF